MYCTPTCATASASDDEDFESNSNDCLQKPADDVIDLRNEPVLDDSSLGPIDGK